jgi:hypothetical protein
MELRFLQPDIRRLDETSAEILACTVWSDQRPIHGLFGLLDWRMAGRLSALAKTEFVTGKLGEALMVPGRPLLPYEKLLVLGMGPKATFGEDVFRTVVQRLMRALEGLRVRRAVVELPGRADGLIEPERATELVMACAGDSAEHDAWWLVEDVEAERRMKQRALDERRRARRV